VISLRGVSKSYSSLLGRGVLAVDNVSLDVSAGEVFGIAGPNGAGKTTIIAMLMGFLNPTSGAITISGMKPRAYVEAKGVAYLPELMALTKTWRVRAALRRLATLDGVPAAEMESEVQRVIDLVEIGEHRGKQVRALSKGNFQRVGLAQALLREREVVIFDEPTHGLDPVWTNRFRAVLTGLRAPHRAIVIASHNLDELERLADRVAIIDKGRIQRVVSVRENRGAGERIYRIRVAGAVAAALAAFVGSREIGAGEIETAPLDTAQLNASLQAALAAGAQVTALGMSGRLTAYLFRFQLRDLLVLRAGLPTFMAVFFGWMIVKTDGSTVDWNGPSGRELARNVVNMFGAYVFIPVATFLGIARLVADDRANGYFRFLFSKPVSLLRFYVQQWVLYGVLIVVLGGILLAWLQANTTTLPIADAMLAIAITWVLVGGVGFLLTSLTNYDGLLLIIIWTVSKILHAVKDADNSPMWGWMRELTRLTVPVQKITHIQNELLAGNPLPIPHTVHVMAYGLLAFAAGVVILRRWSFSR
jgi:ABC-2 type transport system ATP-binding protein